MASSLARLLPHLSRLANLPAADRDLLDRFVQERDEAAFAALVERHGPMVLHACRRLLGDADAAQDAYQAVFLVLARRAGALGQVQSLAGWLYGVARRVALHARRRARPLPVREAPEPQDRHPDPLAELSARELLEIVEEEVARLPEAYRLALVLCCLEGLSQEEAARRLGCTPGSLRGRLERGRARLHARLARRGVTLTAALAAVEVARGGSVLPQQTVQAALAFVRGEAGIAAEVLVLARAALPGTFLGRWKLGLFLLLTLSMAAAGIGRLSQPPAEEMPPRREKPAAPTDRYGDALPEGALRRLGTIRLRHGNAVNAAAFAADGRAVVSASRDGVVHFWEASTGKELLRIDPAQVPDFGRGQIEGLALTPGGKTLAVARLNEPAFLWDLRTSKKRYTLGGDRQRALWVLFSPDGKMIAHGGHDQTVRLSEVDTGKELHAFDGHKALARHIAFSPDGTLLASADDETIRCFDLAASRELSRAEGPAIPFQGVAFSADGKTVAAASMVGKLLRVVEVATGKVLLTVPLVGKCDDVNRLVFTPDGQTLLTGHMDGFVRFRDVVSGTTTRQFRAQIQDIRLLALAPAGRMLATTGNGTNSDFVLRLWEADTGKPLVRFPGPQQGISWLVFSPNSRLVATSTGHWDAGVDLWEAATGKLLRHWPPGGPLAFTPDSKTLLCAGYRDRTIHFFDVATGEETRKLGVEAEGTGGLALDRAGKVLATAGHYSFLRLSDLATGRTLQEYGDPAKTFISQLALSPDGKLLASVHLDQTIRWWETATGKLLRAERAPAQGGCVAFAPDGKLLASSRDVPGGEPRIELCDVATGTVVRALPGKGQGFAGAPFSPDGRTFASAGLDGQLCLWEIATGQLRRKFTGHRGSIDAVAFSPDGRLLASGSADATALLWDLTGQRSPRPAPLRAAEMGRLWTELAADDAALAYQAICTLRAAPQQAVPLLSRHLQPAPPVDARRAAEILRRLDSDQFPVREQAAREIERLGDAAEILLRQALASGATVEVRRRAEQLLARLEGPESLRRARALEVLEQIGDAEARRVLTALAKGAPQTRLTREAQAVLGRLARGS